MNTAKRFLFWTAGITICNIVLPAAWGHFGMLIPESPAVRRGETVTVRYYSGHPYECQLADTKAPAKAAVILPDGRTRLELKPQREEMDDHQGGKVVAYVMKFTPSQRGDHLVVVSGDPHLDEHAGGFVQDELKVLVRVQVQKGWDNWTGQPVELVPLTRPYGLKPGSVFKAQARLDGKPLADAEVEIEKLNPTPPRDIPDDDALITQAAKTDVNGYVVCTLDQPGWWGLLVTAEQGTREHEGKQYPIIRRGVLWVHVQPGGEAN